MPKSPVAPVRAPETGRFLNGNPGRPEGLRKQLGEAFRRDITRAWQRHGPAVIETTIATRPAEFLRVVARLMPRELDVAPGAAEALSDCEIRLRLLAALAEARGLGLELGLGDDSGSTRDGA